MASSKSLEDRAAKYRGATILDLDPPPALSVHPDVSISTALMRAYERDYTHLTVVSGETRALLGYISMPRLKALLAEGKVREQEPVKEAMVRFRLRGRRYRVITMDTPLEELEAFFEGDEVQAPAGGDAKEEGDKTEAIKQSESKGEQQDFAIVTDASRRFVLGVATRWDLDEFVRRRPG